MTSFLLPARFQPQAWIDDNAVDVDGVADFDAARAFLSQEPPVMLRIVHQILEERHDVDELAGEMSVTHSGPFVVSVEPSDLVAFLALHQVWNLADLDEDTMSGLKDRTLKAWTPDTDTLAGMHPGDEGHPVLTRDAWRVEASAKASPGAYWSWVERSIQELVEPYFEVVIDEWDRASPRSWHMTMPPETVSEFLSGEHSSLFVSRDADGYWLGRMDGSRDDLYPSLGLAKFEGARRVDLAYEGQAATIARDMGVDQTTFRVEVDDEAIQVYPRTEGEFPGLVVGAGRSYLDFGPDHEEVEVADWKEGVARLSETRAAPSRP